MRAGNLRHRITVQSPVSTTNAHGGVDFTWATLATVWASLSPESGKEQQDGKQQVAQTTYKVTMRYLTGLTTQCRIVFGTQVLNISSALDVDKRHKEWDLVCIEAV
jgi:SPP1 family predicted phage head-tail adaptor